MEKIDRTYSSSNAKNDFKRPLNSTYYTRVLPKNKNGMYADTLQQQIKEQDKSMKETEERLKEHEERMREQDKRIEKLKQIIADLEEKKKQALEKNLVRAPLKDEMMYPSIKPKIEKVDINTLNLDGNAKMKKAIKGYTSSPKPLNVSKVLPTKPQERIELVEVSKKPSLWSRIKNAIKEFFTVLEEKTSDIDLILEQEDSCKKYNKYTTDKSSEFRQSMASKVKYETQISRDLNEARYRATNKGRILDRHI